MAGALVTRWPLVATAALALASSVGCSEHKKVTECNALVAAINTGVDKIQKATSTGADAGTVSADLRGVAETMDEVAAEAGKIELTIRDLQDYAREYLGLVKEVGAAAREVAEARDKADEGQMQKAQARMDAAVKREDPLVDAINGYCRSP